VNDYLILLSGVVCAGIGGELFVRGAVGLAHWARISPGIIGAVVAAFATSSPELSVSVSAALVGNPQIALGDALGSNIVNVALILALTLVISGIQCPRDSIKRDFPIAVLLPLATGLLLFDGELSRFDGVLMLGFFVLWLVLATIEARKQRSATDEVLGEHRRWLIVCSCIGGLALLVLAGNLIVASAKGIALSLGMDYFIVGVTVVAIGTSTPELATTVIAKLRGHDEVGLGTILGSNIFNGLLIVPVAAIINPIAVVACREVILSLAIGFAAVALIYPPRTGLIHRAKGVLLLLLYCIYLFTILSFRS
jgi:cation:H+ antiporter